MTSLKRMIAIATISAFLIISCDTKEEPSDALYSNVHLQMAPDDDGQYDGAMYRYLDEEPFTGEQIFRYVKNDSVYMVIEFIEGRQQQSIVYNEDGSVKAKLEYKYNNGEYIGFTEYYSDGSKKSDWLQGGASEEGIGFTKEWHPNGQIKFEMQWDENNQYHGLMTKWDEEGNILEQEKYEHGKKVQI